MSYSPAPGLRNPHINTILASTAPRRWWQGRLVSELRSDLEEVVLDCGDGVRLHGEYLHNPRGVSGMVILIHGWEGCSGSAYMLAAGRAFHQQGYSVFNLHLRDHGPSHHLNQEPFLAIRLAEVVDAVEIVQARYPGQRYCLVGFSLGGNIALRVAANMHNRSISLDRVVAVCPPVDPLACAYAISASPIYNRHFVSIWRASFREKLRHYPALEEHADVFEHDDMMELHEAFIPRFSNHPDAASYFRAYQLDAGVLPRLDARCHVLLAADDPVIPVGCRSLMPDLPELDVEITDHGGHCGFLLNYRGQSWLDRRLIELCRPALESKAA